MSDRIPKAVNAIGMVTKIREEAMEANKSCGVATLDVKKAFNTTKWSKIIVGLVKLGAPKYPVSIVTELLQEGLLCYDSDEDRRCSMVPQESVLSPLLEIIIYDGISKLHLPKGVTIVTIMDKILRRSRSSQRRVEDAGLTLAEDKTIIGN